MTELGQGTRAMTRSEYFQRQEEDERFEQERKTFLTDEEKERIQEQDVAAHYQAMLMLVEAHRAEYEKYLTQQREIAGIDGYVVSEWNELRDNLNPLDYSTRL